MKLWEKCEVAKIAIKRGVQNTNSELMAEELKVTKLKIFLNSMIFYLLTVVNNNRRIVANFLICTLLNTYLKTSKRNYQDQVFYVK